MQAKTILAFTTLLLFGLVSCQGPEGAPGPQGPEGPAGPQTVALMYEVEFDLNAANKWESIYTFPANDEIFTEDVALVYLLWDQVTTNGQTRDIWRLMPVSFYNGSGTLSMNYDFTVDDVRIFAEASYPLTNVSFTNEVARIVIVPADYSPNGRKGQTIDYTDYEQVRKAFNLPDTPVKNRGRIVRESVNPIIR